MASQAKSFFVNIVENNYQINIEAHGIQAETAMDAINDVLYEISHDIKNDAKTWIKRQIPDTYLLTEYQVSKHITKERVDIAVLTTFMDGTPCYAVNTETEKSIRHNYITAVIENR